MISKSKNLLCWQYIVGFLLVWATLTVVNLHWLIDDSYLKMFLEVSPIGLSQKLSLALTVKDPGYFFVQNIMSSFASFETFFGLLIFICLALKFSALLQVNTKVGVLDVLPYFLILGFLHEGIQIRIAIALSIALWAIVFFAKNQRVLACFVLLVACTFHISAATFFLVFAIAILYSRFGLIVLISGVIISGVLAYSSIVPELLLKVGVATNARFLAYSQGSIVQAQNKTGLFQYFILFVSFLTGFIWIFYKKTSEVWANLRLMGITSGLLAVAVLQIFRFNVVVSSRLADLLLLPVVLVMGATLSQLKHQKRYWLLVLILGILFIYCAARAYISFRQAPLNYHSIF